MGRCRDLVVVAGVLAVAGCGGPAPPAPGRQQVGQQQVDPQPVDQPAGCGRPMPSGTGGWQVTGRFPASVAAAAGTVTGTVAVRPPVAVRGVTGPGAEAYLVRDGVVVTAAPVQDAVGIRWEVPAGGSRELPALGLLVLRRAGRPAAPGTVRAVRPPRGPPRRRAGGTR